jgi:hypothetical protein
VGEKSLGPDWVNRERAVSEDTASELLRRF